MNASGSDDLVTIGAFARTTGLTPSALRFYDDSGLQRAVAAAAEAEAVKAALALGRRLPRVALSGRLFADAIERVLPAVSEDPEFPILTGILVELSGDAVTVTATDRYRLSTRSLAAADTQSPWSAVLPARELAALVPWFAGSADLALERQDHTVVLSAGGDEKRCTVLPGTFPDCAAMLAALPPTSTRVVVARDALLGAVEGAPTETIRCVVAPHEISVGSPAGTNRRLGARVTGPSVELFFRRDNLRSALASAVGPDLMLDISAPDMPVVIRSATDGDLTTLAMPTASDT